MAEKNRRRRRQIAAKKRNPKNSEVRFERLEDRQLLCTFRAAIMQANFNSSRGAEQIQFAGFEQTGFTQTNTTFLVTSEGDQPDTNLADGICQSTGPTTTVVNSIVVGTPLPAVTSQTWIDGTPRNLDAPAGTAAPPNVTLIDGSATPSSGLVLHGTYARVKGLAIGGFDYHGIASYGNNITVDNVYLGTNAAGTLANPNGYSGIFINGGGTQIRDSVISGNTFYGVQIGDNANPGNSVHGNYIGTNAAGTVAIGNTQGGVLVHNGTFGQRVSNNLISGNGRHGIYMATSGSAYTTNNVLDNIIGTNAAGNAAIPNAMIGTVVGGYSVVRGNLISGNGIDGVRALGTEVHITENRIGTNAGGTAAIANLRGINIGAGSSKFEIANNTVSGNTTQGIMVWRNNGNIGLSKIQGNKIGTNMAGNAAIPNGEGIFLNREANGVVIGDDLAPGPNLNERNIIAGNGGNGITIFAGNADPISNYNPNNNYSTHVAIRDNLIGFSQTSIVALTLPMGNGGAGIWVSDSRTKIESNQIGNNGGAGVTLTTANAMANELLGNHIGVNRDMDVSGNAAGVLVADGANYNYIGSRATVSSPTPANVISGNLGDGVAIFGGSNRNHVANNNIGARSAGPYDLTDLGNGGSGVVVIASNNNTIGLKAGIGLQSNNRLGGGNTIRFNGAVGVNIVSGTGNEIHENKIGDNAGLGILLGPGANNNQVAPILSNVRPHPIGGIQVDVQLVGAPANSDFIIEFFHSQAPDIEGEVFAKGAITPPMRTNSAGFAVRNGVPIGRAPGNFTNVFLTATATQENQGNTSMFSAGVAVPDGPIVINNGGGTGPGGPPSLKMSSPLFDDAKEANTLNDAIKGQSERQSQVDRDQIAKLEMKVKSANEFVDTRQKRSDSILTPSTNGQARHHAIDSAMKELSEFTEESTDFFDTWEKFPAHLN